MIVPAFEKEMFEGYLGSLRESGVDPDQVTFTPVAFSSLGELIEGPRPLLLIDADQDHLNFSFFDERGLSRVRNCDDAVERVKKALATDALDLQQINGDEGRRGKAFLESCRFITEEIRNTIRYFEGEAGEEGKEPGSHRGGSARWTGVAKELTEQLGREVKRIFIEQLGHNDSPLFCESVCSCALRKLLRQGGEELNLRRGGVQAAGGWRGIFLKEFRVPVALCAALLLVVVFRARDGSVVSARSKMSSIRSEMEMESQKGVPGGRGNAGFRSLFTGGSLRSLTANLTY